ncbi:MAG: VOC family protein [Solirubrobacteraceae bacterium]|nr:VOC family protein [Solirubrobacteraceae bacterium]
MTTTTKTAVYWAEIPVSSLERAIPFYEAITAAQFELDETGPNPTAFISKTGESPYSGGHLYEGKPASNGDGPTVHLAIESVEAAAERAKDAGATLVGPIIEIPVGRFQYIVDLDGNSIGLFEPAS